MKILICNEAFIGDVILTTAVIPPLKKILPECKLGFLTCSWSKTVIENHEFIDFIHIHDQAKLNRAPLSTKKKKEIEKKTKKKAIQEIKCVGYDVAIDFHSYSKENSSYILFKSGIPERICYWDCPQPFFYTKLLFWDCKKLHTLENHRMMLRHLGIEKEQLEPFKPCLQYKNLVTTPSSLPQNYFCIHAHAGWPDKEWSIESWKYVLKKMEAFGIPFVFLGKGKNDSLRTSEIISSLQNVVNLCDNLNLRETMEVVKNAQFLLGMDSMAGHLAAHYGIPSLLLYNGKEDIGDWRPYHPYCHIIKADPKYWYCLKDIAPKRPIDMICPDEVLNKAQKILKAHSII